jgi:TonB family protein
MKDRSEAGDLKLSRELADIHHELSSLSFEERPSFGPELLAELEREWIRSEPRHRWPVRQLLAAGVTGLLMVGFGVPSARASLVRLVESLRPVVEDAAPIPDPDPAPPVFELPEALPAALPTEDVPAPERQGPGELPPAPESPAPYDGPEATFPELLDREGTEAFVLRNYPDGLQRAGIGGVVRVLLWVDSLGQVQEAGLERGSGIPELDQAALDVAPSFRFLPGRRRGRPVGTWVEFDVRFEVPPEGVIPIELPIVDPLDRPQVPDIPDLALTEEWVANLMTRPNEGDGEAGEQLRIAIDDDELVGRLGPIEAILEGEPPAGSAPTRWRSEITRALERAVARDPDNAAPLLALARIRQKQGLRTEARILYERGLQRARRNAGVSPAILGYLHYERGALIQEGWLASQEGGRVSAQALPAQACPQTRSSGGAASGYASVDRLIAWNYLCPAALGDVLEEHYQEEDRRNDGDFALMMASFRAAAEAYPAHPEANAEILLALADEGRWREVVEGSRRFAAASGGHPHALLMEGVALQRLARSESARSRFELAFQRMTTEDVDGIRDISLLLGPQEQREYLKTSRDERIARQSRFWASLDPILSTAVNEREVEHWARSAHATLRFGSVDTDPGVVWVRYGPPTTVRVFSERPGTKAEFWDYGSGPDVTFSRMGSRGDMDLTSEGRAYLDDLRPILPHRYGRASRIVSPLPGQVAVFRGATDGTWDVEIHTDVPVALATGERDGIEIGLFLLDGDGRILSERRDMTPARPSTVAVRASTVSGTETIVVELYNETAGRAAALRRSLQSVPEEGAYTSDLMVVRSVARDPHQVLRGAPWMEPLTLEGAVADPAVGLFFELYRVEAPWYRLRAEIVDRDSGATADLRIRPVGEEKLRTSRERRPADGPVTAELVTAEIAEVPPGEYVLRVIAELGEERSPLVLERDFTRR